MLGALGEHIGVDAAALDEIRKHVNPLSKYEFGALRVLPTAKRWFAK